MNTNPQIELPAIPAVPETLPWADCGTATALEALTEGRCEDCASAYQLCSRCAQRTHEDDLTEVDSGRSVCARCRDAVYIWSDVEDIYIRYERARRTQDTGRTASSDYAHGNWYFDDETAEWYEEEPQRDTATLLKYDTDIMEWLAVPDPGKNLVFGVELEMEPHHGTQRDIVQALGGKKCESYILKSDGSLNHGVELVTVPMTLDAHKNEFGWDNVLAPVRALAKSGNHTNNCGMHVHINKAALTSLQIGKMLVFLNSPRTNSGITRVAQRDSNGFCNIAAKNLKDGLYYTRYRYERLNVQEQTCEVRIFKGNLRTDRVLKNLEFCHAMVTFCKDCSLEDADNWNAFETHIMKRRGQYPNLVRFLQERHQPAFASAFKPNKKVPHAAVTEEL